jgi:hypothetical protein
MTPSKILDFFASQASHSSNISNQSNLLSQFADDEAAPGSDLVSLANGPEIRESLSEADWKIIHSAQDNYNKVLSVVDSPENVFATPMSCVLNTKDLEEPMSSTPIGSPTLEQPLEDEWVATGRGLKARCTPPVEHQKNLIDYGLPNMATAPATPRYVRQQGENATTNSTNLSQQESKRNERMSQGTPLKAEDSAILSQFAALLRAQYGDALSTSAKSANGDTTYQESPMAVPSAMNGLALAS